VIRGYEARVDPGALGFEVTAFVFLSPVDLSLEDDVEEALLAMPEVLEIHKIAGDDSFLVKVRAPNNAELARILRHGVEHAGVRSIRTTIVLETARERLALPAGESEA
jgi:Lrp/AsnC family leucine-responsive transcriptional regulator